MALLGQTRAWAGTNILNDGRRLSEDFLSWPAQPKKEDFSHSFNRNDCSRKASQITSTYAIQKQFQAVGTFQNCITGKNRFSKKKFRSFQLSSHFDNLKRNWQKPFFYNSVESMADWSLSSDLYKDSNQDCLCFGKSERPLFHSAN